MKPGIVALIFLLPCFSYANNPFATFVGNYKVLQELEGTYDNGQSQVPDTMLHPPSVSYGNRTEVEVAVNQGNTSINEIWLSNSGSVQGGHQISFSDGSWSCGERTYVPKTERAFAQFSETNTCGNVGLLIRNTLEMLTDKIGILEYHRLEHGSGWSFSTRRRLVLERK